MGHPIPKDLKGEERVLSIEFLDLHLNKAGIIYNGIATLFSAALLYFSQNVILFFIVFIITNIVAYPLAQTKTNRSEFDGGNVRRDIHLKRKRKYKKNKNIYLRNY